MTNDRKIRSDNSTEAARTERLEFGNALAPLPPDGPPDNLLLANVAGTAIPVTLTLEDTRSPDTPADMERAEQRVQLVVGNYTGDWVTFSTAPPYTAEMTLPAEHSDSDGRYSINYRWNQAVTSMLGPFDQYYIVDTQSPGGAVPAPIKLPFAPEDGLALDSLPEDGLSFSIFGYEGMAPGDEIYAMIDSKRQPEKIYTVRSNDLGPKPLELVIPTAMLPIADGKHTFGYAIQDRAGNPAAESAAISINTITKGVGVLQKPSVQGVDPSGGTDNLLDFDDAHALGGAKVTIPFIPEAKAADVVFINWGSRTLGPYSINNPDDDKADALTAIVPYDEIFAEWNATARGSDAAVNITLGYKVKRNNVTAGVAPELTVPVNLYTAAGGVIDPEPEQPGHGVLVAPTIYSGDNDENEIPASSYTKDAEVHVPRQTKKGDDVFKDDDVITVTFGAAVIEVIYDSTDSELNDEYVPVPIPASEFSGQSGVLPLWYMIARPIDGGTGHVSSPVTEVKVTNPAEAPGGGQALREPTWTNAVSNEGEIWLNDISVTVILAIPDYANKAPGDIVTLKAELTKKGAPVRTSTKQHVVADRAEETKVALTWTDFIENVASYEKLTDKARITYQVVSQSGAASGESAPLELGMNINFADDWLDAH